MAKQFLERMTVIHVEDDDGKPLSLEALFHQGREGEPVVLAPSLPALGGSMDHPVLAELCWRLSRAGHATLRFNWRGVGASTGRLPLPPTSALERPQIPPAALEDAFADLRAAIDQHVASEAPRCAVVGYGFGAQVAARAAIDHPAVDRAILIAPPVRELPFDFPALAATGLPVSILVGALDAVAPPDVVEAAVQGRFAVQRIPDANHAFTRGLSLLGQRVVACFPGSVDDERS